MSLGLLLPAGLAALAALLLPLLIHLARHSEQRLTDFAALRWLSVQLRPRQKLRFEEWLLLALRLALLVVLALLLARPVLFGGMGNAPWVAVVPGVDRAAARAAVSLDDAQWHWLAPGFPDFTDTPPQAALPISSLLRELDAQLPTRTPITIIAPEQIGGLDGALPMLSRAIDWRVVAGRMPATPPAPAAAAPALVVRLAADREPYLRYLRAADAAWRVADKPSANDRSAGPTTVQSAPADRALPPQTRWLVWLVPGALPPAIHDWIAGGGIALLDAKTELPRISDGVALWRNDSGETLVRGIALGHGRAMQLTRPLIPEALPELLDARFPQHLRALFDAPARMPARALAASVAPLQGGPAFTPTPRPLQPWLALLVAALFVIERWFASAVRRRPAP